MEPQLATKGTLTLLAVTNLSLGAMSLLAPAAMQNGAVVFSAASQLRELQFLGTLRFGYGAELLAVANEGSYATQRRVLQNFSMPLFAQVLMWATVAENPLMSEAKKKLATQMALFELANLGLTLWATYFQPPAAVDPKTTEVVDDTKSRSLLRFAQSVAFVQGLALILFPEAQNAVTATFGRSSTLGTRVVGMGLMCFGFIEDAVCRGEIKVQRAVLKYLGVAFAAQTAFFLQEKLSPMMGADVQNMMIPQIVLNIVFQGLCAWGAEMF